MLLVAIDDDEEEEDGEIEDQYGNTDGLLTDIDGKLVNTML